MALSLTLEQGDTLHRVCEGHNVCAVHSPCTWKTSTLSCAINEALEKSSRSFAGTGTTGLISAARSWGTTPHNCLGLLALLYQNYEVPWTGFQAIQIFLGWDTSYYCERETSGRCQLFPISVMVFVVNVCSKILCREKNKKKTKQKQYHEYFQQKKNHKQYNYLSWTSTWNNIICTCWNRHIARLLF